MFFARTPIRALLCDENEGLITAYRAMRGQLPELTARLAELAAEHTRGGYYVQRARYNHAALTSCERAALFIYLNKTGFRGLYRTNKRGELNTPCGRDSCLIDFAALQRAASALRCCDLVAGDYGQLALDGGDFVYIDPPYAPVSATSFVAYTRDGFDAAAQTRLRDTVDALDRRGCKLMLSNSDTPEMRALYSRYRVDTVSVRRSIGGTRRQIAAEIVVRNY
jgi:DNA adenine methylase